MRSSRAACFGGASSPTTPARHTTSSSGLASSRRPTTRWHSPRRSKLEQAVDEGLLLGEPLRGRFETLRESAQVRRSAQLAQSLGVFISCHMDGELAARSRWVTVVAMRGDTTTSRDKCEGGTMRGNVQPANVLRGGVTMRGDASTRRDKREGGAISGEAALRRHVERRWRRRDDVKTIWGK